VSIPASSLQPGNFLYVFLKLGLALEIRQLPNGDFDRVVPTRTKVAEEWAWTKIIGTLTKYENGFLYLESTLPMPSQAVPYPGRAYSVVIHYSAVKRAHLIDPVAKEPKTFQINVHKNPIQWDHPVWVPYQTKQTIIFP